MISMKDYQWMIDLHLNNSNNGYKIKMNIRKYFLHLEEIKKRKINK